MDKEPTSAQIAIVSNDISYIKSDIKEIKDSVKELTSQYVTQLVFNDHLKADEDHEKRLRIIEKEAENNALVKKIVYGLVALILVSVIGAILALVIIKTK